MTLETFEHGSLDEFRGFVLGFQGTQTTPTVELYPVALGYYLTFKGRFLESSRNQVRLFKSSDAAISFVERHICMYQKVTVVVSVSIHSAL
jgi:hypothetical protein